MKKNMLGMSAAALVVATGSIATSASAALVYANTVTTDGGIFSGNFAVDNLMDEGVTSATSQLSASVAASGIAYATDEPPTGGYPVTIIFNFDTATDIDALYLWNNATNATIASKGIRNFSLKFYDDVAGEGGGGTLIGAEVAGLSAAQGPITGTYAAEQFTFSKFSGVRSVELIVADNHIGSSWVGAREVAFNAVPEPSAAALLGLGGLTLMLRRSR